MSILNIKKATLSIFCAMVMLIYVPFTCALGNALADERNFAKADSHKTCEHETEPGEICEICILSEK